MNKRFIIQSSLISVIILFIMEQVIVVNYFIKTGSKLLLFIVIPIIYIKVIKKVSLKEGLSLGVLRWKQLSVGVILGLIAFVVVIVSYVIFRPYIDVDAIVTDLNNKKITPSTFILIGLYITFVNAFLEEFFFRGFIFLNLYEGGQKRFAYLYSSILFALYHIVIFLTWFTIPLMLLALVGLLTIGLVFNYVNTKSNNFLNSYIIHVIADVAIILIGFHLFDMI